MKKTLRINKIIDSTSTQGIVARTERDIDEIRELARTLSGSTGHVISDWYEELNLGEPTGWYVFDMEDVAMPEAPEDKEPVVEEVVDG